jgi:multidrug efflux system membrane fusion protein
MSKRKWVFGVAVLALMGAAVLARGIWSTDRGSAARAQAKRGGPVPVEIGKAVRKQVPVRIEALGTVTPIASVAIKARLETRRSLRAHCATSAATPI